MHQAAVRIHGDAIRRHELDRLADALGHHFRGLHLVGLHVDDPEPERERRRELAEERHVVLAAARELERELLHARLQHRGKEIPVSPLPRRLAVPVAVADVQPDARADALHQHVERADRPRQIFGEPRVIRLVDLQLGCAGLRQLAQLPVHHAREIHRERFLVRVVTVAHAFHQRVRPGDRHLGDAVGEATEKAEVAGEPERGRGEP